MKSSTRNIGMCSDIDWSHHCDCCKALKADVDVSGGKARSVDLRCEVADEIDTVKERQHDKGMSIDEICRGIRAKIKKAGHVDPLRNSKTILRTACVPVQDAVRFLLKIQFAADIKSRAFDPIEAGED